MWNHYPKCSHNTWATSCSIIAYGEFKDKICKEKVSGYIWSTELIAIA